MKILIATLADSANVADNSKLNLLGAFNMIPCPSFPAIHPMMALVLRLDVDFEDGGKTHELTITLVDEDMKPLARAAAQAQVGPVPPGRTGVMNQIVNFAGTVFTRPGTYNFVITWDGPEVIRVPLYIVGVR